MQTMMEKGSQKDLREAVLRQLEWEPEITSPDISVSVKEDVVILTGFVRSYAEKVAAERAAKSVHRVQAIANDIEVKPLARTDPEIARDVVEAMKLDLTVPDDRIKTSVRDGFVSLEGTVEWNYQREAAESRARNVSGVRGLINNIALKPRVSTTEVKTKIEDALRRSAEVDAHRITVSMQDGIVTLNGQVHSWFEKEEARRAAWAAPGVSQVIDHIAVGR